MSADSPEASIDVATLRFTGDEEEKDQLVELRAADVSEVLLGITSLVSDFAKAGAFDAESPVAPEVFIRPAREGSFILDIVRVVQENPETAGLAASAIGGPTLAQLIAWATRSMRADVEEFEYLENGNVKIKWQDKTAQEVPAQVWEELQKRPRRRKKQLRQIMTPLSDDRVGSVEVSDQKKHPKLPDPEPRVVLTRPDYDAVRPSEEVTETSSTFTVEAQMSAIDFDDPERWRVKTKESNRLATLIDKDFLGRIATGLAIRKSDIFRLQIREDVTTKNGRSTTKWTVLKVENHRRGVHDDDDDA